METNKIKENNKLIALFMGAKEIRENNFQFPKETGIKEKYIYSGLPIQLDGLKYHYSWESLMEVVEKIQEINFSGIRVDVLINRISCKIYTSANTTNSKHYYSNIEIGDKLIEAVYKAVYKFIIWYNNL